MDLSIRVAFSAIDKLTRPVSAASKAIGGLSDSLKKTQSSIKDLEKSASSFDKLRSQANDTAQKLRSTQRAFDGLNQKQREGGQLTEAQTARLETLRNKLSRLTDTYNKQTTQLRAAGQAVRQHGVNLNAGSGAVQSAIRRTEQYSQALERERQRLAAVTRAQASYERAKETGSKLRGGGTMAIAGAGAAGYAGGRFLAPAVGFDEEMSRVQALTRLDKGDSQLAALRAQAKKARRGNGIYHPRRRKWSGVPCNGWLHSTINPGGITWRAEYGAGRWDGAGRKCRYWIKHPFSIYPPCR